MAPEASAEPALKPNQPQKSNPAPIAASGRFDGGKSPPLCTCGVGSVRDLV